MKIAHFNTLLNGGAAIAAKRIHDGLRPFRSTIVSSQLYHQTGETGNNRASESLSGAKSSDGPGLNPIPLATERLNRITTPIAYRRNKQRQYRIYDQFNLHLAGRSPELESFSMAELPKLTRLDWPSISADIVHLHWVSHLVDYPSFFQSIPKEIPMVWTIHDMNPFTGGCHYADQCLRYRFGCGDCPQIAKSHVNDVSRTGFQVKREALLGRNIVVVTPSIWMGEQAKLSPIWPKTTSFQVIHYGLDLLQFAPLDKQQARRELELDPDAILVGFGAADLQAPRKGMQHLIRALQNIERENRWGNSSKVRIEGVLFGSGTVPQLKDVPPIHTLGFADSAEKLRRIYSALDLVVVPSREDNQPQIGLEAMACGTPVIGFASGGIPEFLRHAKTGLIADLHDEKALANQILLLARDSELRIRLGQAAREMMETEFEIVKQSERYIGLYQSILSGLASNGQVNVAQAQSIQTQAA